jgi:hydrogenase maturation protease
MRACEEPSPRRRPRILVAGLGNLLLRDDGVGVHAVRALRNRVPRGVRAVEVGTAILDALHLFEWADTILALDAMQAGGTPGSIYQFGVDDVADHPVPTSLHELDLRAALRLLMIPPSPTIVVLGVEPEIIEAGLTLSSSVQAALPQLVTAASNIAARWSAGAQV